MIDNIFKMEDFKDAFYYDQHVRKAIAKVGNINIVAQLVLYNKTYIPFDNEKSIIVGSLSFYKEVPYHNEYFKRTETFDKKYENMTRSIKVASTTPLNEVWLKAIDEANKHICESAIHKLREIES